MKSRFLLLTIFLLLVKAEAQAVQYAFQVSFKDKQGAVSLNDSASFLSPRSLARREAQGIRIDSTDLPVNRVYIDSILHLTGGKLHEISRWLNFCVVLLSDSSQIHQLDGKAFVTGYRLVANYTTYLHRSDNTKTNNTSTSISALDGSRATALDATYYGNTWLQTLLVKGNSLADAGYQGAGKLIAVLDAGFLYANTNAGFDSLWAQGRVVDMHNFTYDTTYVFGWDSHGMSVLSTMAGYIPGTFVGTAPKASYALFVTEDGNSEQPIEVLNMVCGIERADSIGADIVSSSLGYNTFDISAYNYVYHTDLDGKSTPAARAVNIATSKGILVVMTAGNEGGDSWNNVLTPGDADSALTIGSVYVTGVNASTSGYGPNAAGQIKPDVCAMGQGAAVFYQNGLGGEDGTSFSTPQVAGWAACLWEAAPTATPWRLRKAITECANHYATPGNQIGYGVPDFSCAMSAVHVTDSTAPIYPFHITIPNPFHSNLVLNVSVPETQSIDFRMFDITGREAMHFAVDFFSGQNPAREIDASYLPAGIYILKATGAKNHQVFKIVKE